MNEIITLENKRLKAVIYPKRGANLIRLYDKKYSLDILRTPQELSYFESKSPYLYGMPILFPPNRISGAEFAFEERVYKFPVNEAETNCFIHGTMHETEFEILEKKDDFAKLIYTSNEIKPYLTFPHTFSIAIEYKLVEEKIYQSVTILNASADNMPVGLGFHTTFNTKFNDKAVVYVNVEKEFQRDEKYLPTGEYSAKTPLIKRLNKGYCVKNDNISNLFEMGNNHLVELKYKDIKINYLLDEKYKYLMLFNVGSKKNYICIEPQTWLSNCPNMPDREKYGFKYIKSNNSVTYKTCIYVSSE